MVSLEKCNIICLLWKGEFRGRDYRDEDVARLKEMVERHIDRDFRMYCLTNDPKADVPAEKIMLNYNWPGWWSKVELFRPDLPCGRTLYLDLDTTIVRSLQPMLDYEGDLVMFPSPFEKKKLVNAEGKRMVIHYQAGTMLFTPGALHWVYDTFRADAKKYMRLYRSEQDIYGEWLPNQPTFPQDWLLKTANLVRNKKIRENTIIISGRPKNLDFRQLNEKVCM